MRSVQEVAEPNFEGLLVTLHSRESLHALAYAFEDPDLDRFPALRIAKSALAAGGGAPAAMNGADEVAVAAFLDGRIGFLDIAATVEETLTRMDRQALLHPADNDPLESARVTDATARRVAGEVVSGLMAPLHA